MKGVKMKKALALLLSFCVLFGFSLAEEDDLFELATDDQILNCYNLTMKHMRKRGLSPYAASSGVVVPAGKYIIGEDIPAGSYRLEFSDDPYDSGSIFLYDENGVFLHVLFVGKLENVQVYGKLDLVDGMIFDLRDTTATFYTYTGLFGEIK